MSTTRFTYSKRNCNDKPLSKTEMQRLACSNNVFLIQTDSGKCTLLLNIYEGLFSKSLEQYLNETRTFDSTMYRHSADENDSSPPSGGSNNQLFEAGGK